MNYFYFRVSTKSKRGSAEEEKEFKQTFDRQKHIFQTAGYELTKYNQFFDRESGSTRADTRDGFNAMVEHLQEGDWVFFTETSRFARNYIDGMEVLDLLTQQKKVNVKFVSGNFVLEAGVRYNPQIWFTLSQLLLADEYQRRLIGDATSKALQAKIAKGQKLGRQRIVTKEQVETVKAGMFKLTQRELAELSGLSLGMVNKIVRGEYEYEEIE